MQIPRTLVSTAVLALAVTGVGATAGTAAAAPAAGKATYIVTVAPGTSSAAVAARAAHGLGGSVEHVYSAALNGFAVTVPTAAAAQLERLPGVVAVEADQQVQGAQTQTWTDAAPVSWGLDRIDQDTPATNNTYSTTATGLGVTAYVIDTGIRLSHGDFAGRVRSGEDEVDGGTAEDCNGHGTHVAGTIGGTKYGVAKSVSLVAVRVLDCSGSGSNAGVIAGIDFVTRDHAAGAPAVANMSLGGGTSTALDQAVQRSIDDGVTYAVAAGNGNQAGVAQDACKSSPARVGAALTVGATDKTDTPPAWSNYGKCVDLFAPGVGITSDWVTDDAATNTISGTSMATPHVTGVAALYLQDHPAASPAAVTTAFLGLVDKDQVRTTRTSNNDLLFTHGL